MKENKEIKHVILALCTVILILAVTVLILAGKLSNGYGIAAGNEQGDVFETETDAYEEEETEETEETVTVVAGGGEEDGNQICWELSSNGILTISGNGAIRDYNYYDDAAPWTEYPFEKVIIEEGITAIGDEAFYDCYGLKEISLPESLVSIGYYAFCHCDLSNIALPQNIECLDVCALASSGDLGNLVLPNSLTEIGDYAFSNSGVTSVILPRDIAEISGSVFNENYELFEITAHPESQYLTTQDGVLYTKDMTTLLAYPGGKSGDFTVPETVSIIGKAAFMECVNLSGITLPENLQRIGVYAFWGCTGLQDVVIPANVARIEDQAFVNCEMDSVTFAGDAPIFEWDVFGCTSATVYYPANNSTWTEEIMGDHGGELLWKKA